MVDVELAGNALCLDFTNTVNVRPVPQRDWLDSVAGFQRWAAAVDLPLDLLPEDPAALADARTLREAIHRVFEPLTRAAGPAEADLGLVLDRYAQGVRAARLSPGATAYGLVWPPPRTVRTLLFEVAASAVELLTHGPLDRLGACPGCGWLFLDISRNRRRRWCSMATCGGREKARRYYAAHTGPTPPPVTG